MQPQLSRLIRLRVLTLAHVYTNSQSVTEFLTSSPVTNGANYLRLPAQSSQPACRRKNTARANNVFDVMLSMYLRLTDRLQLLQTSYLTNANVNEQDKAISLSLIPSEK